MGVLEGVKVVELGLILPVAALGGILADQGADVVKVEPVPNGDYIRYFPEQVGEAGGTSYWHLVLNRDKRSILVDLRTAEGRAVLHDLVRDADVFVTNLIADQPSRLGAGYDELRAVNPGLVYCQLTGFGATGPYAELPSHGMAMASLTGQVVLERDEDGWLRTGPDDAPGGGAQSAGQPVQAGPIWAAFGIAGALWRRSVTGEGCYLDVANTEATLALAWVGLPPALNPGAVRVEPTVQSFDLKSAKHAFYEAGDGKHVFVAMIEPKFWIRFCKELGRDDLLEGLDADVKAFDAFDEERNRYHRRELEALFRTRTRDEWTEFFLANDLPCSPVRSTDELVDDPQFAARQAIIEVDHPVAGPFLMAAEPLGRAEGPPRIPSPAPDPGQHTDEVLRALGYGDERIAQLRGADVVA